MRAYPTVIRP